MERIKRECSPYLLELWSYLQRGESKLEPRQINLVLQYKYVDVAVEQSRFQLEIVENLKMHEHSIYRLARWEMEAEAGGHNKQRPPKNDLAANSKASDG